MILISIQNVQKAYGGDTVLRDVTFSLQKGEKMGLVGVNGSGKTTLMRLLTGEEQADGGAIHMLSLMAMGMPSKADNVLPALRRSSLASASLRAVAANTSR